MLGVSRGMSYIVTLAAIFASLLSVCSVRSAHHDIGYFVLEVIIVLQVCFCFFCSFSCFSSFSTCNYFVFTLFTVCFVNLLIGTLRSNDADGDENVQKTIGFISKTTALHVHHTFFVHFFPVFARLRRENA